MRRLLRGALGAAGLALAVVGVAAAPAGAHAVLVSSDPADGARLAEAPDQVQLTFSEAVSADLGGLQVFAADGGRVDRGAVRVDGSVVEVDLAPDLAEGSYVVTYRIISADAHPVSGGIVFSVGSESGDVGSVSDFIDQSGQRAWEVVGAAGRGLSYAGILLAAGGALFLAVVHRAASDRRPLVLVVCAAATVGMLAALLAVPVKAALGTGQGAGALTQEGVLTGVLADGLGWSLALLLVGAGALVLGVQHGSSVAALAGAAVSTGAFAVVGHNRATDPEWLVTAADVLHVWAAACWFGGLVLLWLTLRERRRGDAEPAGSASLVSRFSSLAALAALAVAVPGVVMGWREVRTLDALTSTTYGWLLVAKVALVAGVLAVAAYNRYRLVPATRAGKTSAALARLRRTVSLEAGALVVVIGLTGVLVNVTPARTAVGIGVVFEETVDLGEAGAVQVIVDPASAGTNQIHLYTYDPSGRPADIAEQITLELSLPSAGLGPIAREPRRAGPAHFQLDGDTLATAGTWTIEISARVDRFEEASATVEVPVSG